MLATFIQRWARRYIRITQSPRYSPHKRARLRAFFSDGVDQWHVSWAVEALPTLLHLSLFLFFVGLVIYLFSTNHFVFGTVVWWVVLSSMAYLSIALLPIFWPNSPYYAPLSSILWSLYACISYAAFNILSSPVFGHFGDNAIGRFRGSRDYYRKRIFKDMGKIAEETTLQQSSVIDAHVLESIFDALGEDGAWEKFFEAIPGFFDSELVNVDREHFSSEFRNKFRQALSGFLHCTFSISSVSESLRSDRLVICLNAAHAALGSDGVSQIIQDILSGRWPELLQSVEMGHSLRRWSSTNDERFTPSVRRIVAQIVVCVRERDNRWIALVKAEYGMAEHVLREHIGHGDSVLLSILIHVIYQAFYTGPWTPWILLSLSKFTILDTSPELQHAFCALWNDLVREAWSKERTINIPVEILREVRHAYIDLHEGTDAALTAFSASTLHFDPVLVKPQSYQLCNVASHRRSSTIHIPVTGSHIVPSHAQLDHLPTALPPHPPPKDSDHTSDCSAALQQAEEVEVNVEPPSSTDHVPDPSHTQTFTLSNLATNPVQTVQVTSIVGRSVPESIGTAITWDVLVPGEATRDPRQSVPSASEIAATNIVSSDDPMPQIHSSESGDSSQAPVTPLIFQDHNPVPATITPSTSLYPGDDSDAPDTTPSTTLFHPLEGNKQQDTIALCAALETSEIPFTVNPIPRSIHNVFPTIVVSETPSLPMSLSSLSSYLSPAKPFLFVESALINPDHIPPALRSSSSSLTSASSHSGLDAQVTLHIGTPSPHDDTQDLKPPIPTTLLLHSAQASPAHDIVATTVQPENQA
jgi:hypothetical protein